MALNKKQVEKFNLIAEGKNVFISGGGGVGKSYLVKEVMAKYPDDTILLAPTGIAALNIGGSTIHSAFKFPLSILGKKHYSRIQKKAYTLFENESPIKRIVIDEISMVRADVLEVMDQQLRRITKKNIPFGGYQIIAVGDFFQLPPVLTQRDKAIFYDIYDSEFAFGGNAWAGANFHYGDELDEIMRQKDGVFIQNLQKVRKKLVKFEESIKFFNMIAKHNTKELLDNDPVFLCTTNKSADLINADNYDNLDYEEHSFKAEITGEFKERPSPQELKLKYGAKIIFTSNTDDFKNGETGYVVGFLDKKIHVIKESDESDVFVEPFKWEQRENTITKGKLSSYPVGSYTQYPVKLGWAVTIHKSQGMSLDNVVIDLGRGCFCSGQLYVALSRIKTLDGVGLIRDIRPSDAIVSKEVKEFYDNDCKGIGLF